MMWLELMPVVSALNCSTAEELNVQPFDNLVPVTQMQVLALVLQAATSFLRTHIESEQQSACFSTKESSCLTCTGCMNPSAAASWLCSACAIAS